MGAAERIDGVLLTITNMKTAPATNEQRSELRADQRANCRRKKSVGRPLRRLKKKTLAICTPPAQAPIEEPLAQEVSLYCCGERITVWNRTSKRKVSGNAAPKEKNLHKYLSKHPDCEFYTGQDKLLTSEEKSALIAEQNRISIWNKLEQRRISGTAAPSQKNLAEYLAKRPHCEVYAGQNQPPGTCLKAEPAVEPPATPVRNELQMYMDQDMTELVALHKIPDGTSLADMFHTEDTEMHLSASQTLHRAPLAPTSHLNRDFCSNLKPNEDDVFSMGGLADSLDLDMGFLDKCGGRVAAEVSHSQLSKLDLFRSISEELHTFFDCESVVEQCDRLLSLTDSRPRVQSPVCCIGDIGVAPIKAQSSQVWCRDALSPTKAQSSICCITDAFLCL